MFVVQFVSGYTVINVQYPPSPQKSTPHWTRWAITYKTRTWANAQPDGRPAEDRWHPLFNAAKFGWRPLLDAMQ